MTFFPERPIFCRPCSTGTVQYGSRSDDGLRSSAIPGVERQAASLRCGNGSLLGCWRCRSFCSRCVATMVWTGSARELHAADAICQWSLRRWLLCEACTSCGLHGSRITFALGTQRGFIVHMGALDGPAKWLCVWRRLWCARDPRI